MLKNVTLTLDEKIVRQARLQAAGQGVSVSRWMSDLVLRELGVSDTSLQALERAKQRSAQGWDIDAAHRLSREEANSRGR